MSYLGELRQNVRPLAAASLGVGSSLPLFAYTNSVFAPHLIKEFGWTRSQFALIGLTMLGTLVTLPVIGRFTDRLGVRRVALIGTVLLPLCFLAYSRMQGSFAYFVVVFSAVLVVGAMTSPLVYARLIVQRFERARGLALTIVNCGPAVIAILIVPLLNIVIERYGWRTAYLVLGAFCLSCGILALLLIPPRPAVQAAVSEEYPVPGQTAKADFRLILRSPVTWVLLGGFFLCLLQTPLHATQMNLMLLDNGLTTQNAANIVSVYALGTIFGRIACGLALDRYATPMVAAVSMGVPALGYLLLATSFDALPVIVGSMFLIGLSVGAESDLFSFLVARYFKLRIFSSTLSLLTSAAFLASAVGATLASAALKLTDSFAPLLYLIAAAIAAGSALLLLLPASDTFEPIG